jgi:hypothetical protein
VKKQQYEHGGRLNVDINILFFWRRLVNYCAYTDEGLVQSKITVVRTSFILIIFCLSEISNMTMVRSFEVTGMLEQTLNRSV